VVSVDSQRLSVFTVVTERELWMLNGLKVVGANFNKISDPSCSSFATTINQLLSMSKPKDRSSFLTSPNFSVENYSGECLGAMKKYCFLSGHLRYRDKTRYSKVASLAANLWNFNLNTLIMETEKSPSKHKKNK